MSFDDYQYRLTHLTPAQPGWLSVAHPPTSSTGEIQVYGLPVAAWAIATYDMDDEPYDHPVGLVATADGLGPAEAEDDIHLGYCAPGEDPSLKFRDAAVRKLKARRKVWDL